MSGAEERQGEDRRLACKSYLAWRPLHFSAPQQVDMKMRNAFAAILSIIYYKAESFTAIRDSDVTSNLAGDDKEVPKSGAVIVIRFTYSRNGLLWNDKDVMRCLWINILKCD